MIEHIPILRHFICQHEEIYIDGFRGASAKADYRCKECDKRMSGQEVYGNYHFKTDE